MPNENISIEDYIESLTGENFISTINNAENTTVFASMPKFEYDYEIQLNDVLETLGMPDAFDSVKADFRNMAVSPEGNLFIGEVLHKTFISVDELGTKAGAVTKVEINDEGGLLDPQTVRLDRPFVYAIIDNDAGLPLFIGTVTTLVGAGG